MSLVKFNPRGDLFADLAQMQKNMNRMFSTFWGEDGDWSLASWYPSVDISEGKDEFVVKVELPGVSRNDVKITLQENVLTISGEKKHESESRDRNYHRVERSYGSFSRSFRMPSLVKGDKIDAHYKDGILTINLPKAEEAKSKEIEIKF
jgi:HSP20 family protein